MTNNNIQLEEENLSSSTGTQNIEKLRVLFKSLRPWSFPAPKENFDKYKFTVEESQHRNANDFFKLNPVGRIHSTSFDSNTFQNHCSILGGILSPSEYSFFYNHDDPESYFSVHNEEAKQAAISLGYTEIKVKHYTHPRQIPLLHTSSSTKSVNPETDNFVPPTNKNLIIMKLNTGEKFAKMVVRAFEENYYYKDSANGNILKASPCIMWTKSRRKEHGLSYKDDPFYNWCCSYYAVKFLLKEQELDDIKLSQKKLMELARNNVPSKQPKQNWYDFLVDKLENE